jgi:hypothetical protein
MVAKQNGHIGLTMISDVLWVDNPVAIVPPIPVI